MLYYGYEEILGKKRKVRYCNSKKDMFILVYKDDVEEVGQMSFLTRKEWDIFLRLRNKMENYLNQKNVKLSKKERNEIIAHATNTAFGLGEKEGYRIIDLELQRKGIKNEQLV